MQTTEKTAITQAEANKSNLPTTKQINVTNLTPKQQRKLFCDCINQAGFTGFNKKKNGNKTYYIFTYGIS